MFNSLLFRKPILSPKTQTHFDLLIVCMCNLGQAQAKWDWGNIIIPFGKICSVALSVIFLFFSLLTTLIYFHYKTVFGFYEGESFTLLDQNTSHLIKLSLVLKQVYCQVYILKNMSSSESCLHTYRMFGGNVFFHAIFRNPFCFKDNAV